MLPFSNPSLSSSPPPLSYFSTFPLPLCSPLYFPLLLYLFSLPSSYAYYLHFFFSTSLFLHPFSNSLSFLYLLSLFLFISFACPFPILLLYLLRLPSLSPSLLLFFLTTFLSHALSPPYFRSFSITLPSLSCLFSACYSPLFLFFSLFLLPSSHAPSPSFLPASHFPHLFSLSVLLVNLIVFLQDIKILVCTSKFLFLINM